MEAASDLGRVGLVLSGGGARGFAHIGVLRVLERAGAHFDVIAGTSMGAILGAFYASGRRSDDLFRLAETTGWRDVVDLSLQTGLFKGDRLETFLAAHLPHTFEELDLPLAVTTTDIETGEGVVHMEGDLIRAIRASSSFPGAFEPIQLGGRTLADGGIVNNLPVAAATLLGATRSIASDVTAPRRSVYAADGQDANWWERMVQTVRLERRTPMAQMLFRSSDIMQSILVDIQYSLHPADLRIRLDMPEVRVESFRDFRKIVSYGEETAERALDAVGGLQGILGPPRKDSPERTFTRPRRSMQRTR
ncbi:MAG TPA: patatin-like phospholipase family protein [Trueperaceae bacterium]|nr:patatin-like phospholipase family protein [Trueperaceae bacterium]